MKIAIIGTGYVGSVTGACFAEMGNTVICVDNNPEKIKQFESGKAPLHEKDLDELVVRNLKNKTLSFSTDLEKALDVSDIAFIAVGTPPNEDGSADLSHVIGVAQSIGQLIKHELIIVDKSTVPVGTAEKVRETIAEEQRKRQTNFPFHVVSNPEFLAQGTAVKDFMRPSRVVVGADDSGVLETMRELYAPFMHKKINFHGMDPITAEITKYGANSVLAAKISINNDLANVCALVGADYEKVRRAISDDPRIGEAFMYAGPGFGGSCFPKDVKALIKIAREHGYEAGMFLQALETNERQKHILADMALDHFDNNLIGKKFAIWGLAFKAGTDDMRESSAITIINKLIDKGAKIQAHDPEAMKMAQTPEYFGNNPAIKYFENKYEALEDVDGLLIITEWEKFRSPDFSKMKDMMKQSVIFDGRLIYDPVKMNKLGFVYYSIGRPIPKKQ